MLIHGEEGGGKIGGYHTPHAQVRLATMTQRLGGAVVGRQRQRYEHDRTMLYTKEMARSDKIGDRMATRQAWSGIGKAKGGKGSAGLTVSLRGCTALYVVPPFMHRM